MSDLEAGPLPPKSGGPPGTARRLLVDIGPLRSSADFRRLWVGQAISGIGAQIATVAVAIQVYRISHSSLAVGAIGAAVAIPLIAFGLPGGSFADAVDRRALVLFSRTGLTAVSIVFALQAAADLHVLWLLYLLLVLQSALSAVSGPASRAFVPRLLPPEQLAAAAALTSLTFQVAVVVGPLIAGLLIAAVNLSAAYAFDALSYGFALYATLRLPPMSSARSRVGAGLRSMKEGLVYLRRQRVIGAALLVDLNATVFGMPRALFPALASTRFGGGPAVVGFLYAAPAIGGLIMATLSGPVTHLRRQGRALLYAVAVWGGAIACFAVTHYAIVAVGLLAIAGAADVVNGVCRTAIQQVNTPDQLQGRVGSLGYIVGAGGPSLGDIEAGTVASITSPVVSAVSGGIACVLGVAILGSLMPGLFRYDALKAGAATPSSIPEVVGP